MCVCVCVRERERERGNVGMCLPRTHFFSLIDNVLLVCVVSSLSSSQGLDRSLDTVFGNLENTVVKM